MVEVSIAVAVVTSAVVTVVVAAIAVVVVICTMQELVNVDYRAMCLFVKVPAHNVHSLAAGLAFDLASASMKP